MTTIRKLLTGFGALFCAVLFSSAAVANNSWGTYHWARTANPFTLQVVDSMTSSWDGELTTALSRWSLSDVLDLTVTSSNDSKKIRRTCKMVSGKMRVCNDSYGFNGWLGLATIGIDANGHIDVGSAQMNDSYASYWDNPGEKNHVVCQEIGHVLGLDHTSTDGSSQDTCMDYSQSLTSQYPNDHDYAMLASIYQHVDSYSTLASLDGGGGSGSGGGCNAPAGKGCNKMLPDHIPLGVRVFKGPHSEIWVAPRGQNGLWIHHIRLAP